MKRLALMAVLVAACGGPSAPAAFNDPVCGAYRAVAETAPLWTAVGAALRANDLSGADAQFTIMEPKLNKAIELIADAGEWAPGAAFASNVQIAAADVVASIRQFRAGNYDEATKALKAGNEKLSAATDAVPAMKAAGLSC